MTTMGSADGEYSGTHDGSDALTPSELNSRFTRVRRSIGALEKALLQGPRSLSRSDLEERYGVADRLSTDYWRGLGFSNVGYDTAVFTHDDAEAIADLAALVDSGDFSEDTFITIARGVGFHQGRLAMWLTEALVDEFKQTDGMSDTEARLHMLETIPQYLEIFEEQAMHVFRRQMAAFTARAGAEILRTSTDDWGDEALPLPRAVGFADLVQFTRLAKSVGGIELADVVKEFEGVCRDVISEGGGRLVKTVGDEVMFLADTPEDGVRIALSIAETIAAEPELPKVRVGLAWGNMFARYGDVFGPKVNLAARLEGIARPGAVVIDAETADILDTSFPGGFTRAAEFEEDLHGIGPTRIVRIERGNAALISLDGPQ